MNQLVCISYLTLVFDNMLLTMVVPILPDYLSRLEDRDDYEIKLKSRYSDAQKEYATESLKDVRTQAHLKNENKSFSAEEYQNEDGVKNGKQDKRVNVHSRRYFERYRKNRPKELRNEIANESAANRSIKHLKGDQSDFVHKTRSNFHPLDAYAARAHQTGNVGVLLSTHGFLQFMFNGIAGHSLTRLGHKVSQTLGLSLLLLSALVYSIAERFFYLVLARGLHGVGSSFLIISAMSMIAKVYIDEEERCVQMGSTMSGIGAGVLIGYPYGGIAYQLFGKSTPFCIFIICLLVLLVTIGVSTMCIATLEPCLPIWLINNFHPAKWQLGMAFIPDSIGYLLGTKYLTSYVLYFGKWTFSKMALILVALSAIMIPSVTSIYQLIIPHFALGLSLGAIDAAMMPMLAYIVDIKFNAHYGLVYAIAQIAVCTAYGIAPLVGSQFADKFGFNWLMRLLGVMNLSQALLIHLLVRNNVLLSVESVDDRQIEQDFNKLINRIITISEESRVQGYRLFVRIEFTVRTLYMVGLMRHWLYTFIKHICDIRVETDSERFKVLINTVNKVDKVFETTNKLTSSDTSQLTN